MDIIAAMALRPYLARRRISVLGDVAFKSEDAANALLKLLEEPSPDVLFVLTSDAPRGLLDTVRSRMVEIAFDPLTRDQVAGLLEREGVAQPEARAAAGAALGSVTRARALLEGGRTGLREGAIAWFCDAVRGEVPDQAFLRLEDRTVNAAERREALIEALEVVRTVARDWAALSLGGDGVPLLAADVRPALAALPQRSQRDVVQVLTAVGRALDLATGQFAVVRLC